MSRTDGAGTLTYPKGEAIWVQYCTKDGELKSIITSKSGERSFYYAYERSGNGFRKLGRGKDPAELEEKYIELE